MAHDVLLDHFGLILVGGLFGILVIVWIGVAIVRDVRQSIDYRKNVPTKPLPTQKVQEVAGVLLVLGAIVPIAIGLAVIGLAESWW